VSSPNPASVSAIAWIEIRCRVSATGKTAPATNGFERGCERAAAGALGVEADGQAARLAQRADELADPVRHERAGRVVEQQPRGAEVGQPLRLLDEDRGLAGVAVAVDEAGGELAAGGADRLGRLGQVGRVVERVVEPEDVDPVLGRARDEAPDDVAADRPGADEEAAAEGERQRRPRPGLQRADPLPGALDPPADGAVEDPAAGDLEVREPGRVEDARELEDLPRRCAPGQGLLAEQPDRRVHEPRHRGSLVHQAQRSG
jgi:hypothetical protein